MATSKTPHNQSPRTPKLVPLTFEEFERTLRSVIQGEMPSGGDAAAQNTFINAAMQNPKVNSLIERASKAMALEANKKFSLLMRQQHTPAKETPDVDALNRENAELNKTLQQAYEDAPWNKLAKDSIVEPNAVPQRPRNDAAAPDMLNLFKAKVAAEIKNRAELKLRLRNMPRPRPGSAPKPRPDR